MKNKIVSHELKFYYIRGVAPHEKNESLLGKNGQIKKSSMIRLENEPRLAFGLNEYGLPGVSEKLRKEFILEPMFYANQGAVCELFPNSIDKPDLDPRHTGFFLIFQTNKPLPLSAYHLKKYAKWWRTTSILPDNIDKSLIGVTKAPFHELGEPFEGEKYPSGAYSELAQAHPVIKFINKLK
ncbi:MAG: hypothetical protein PHV30_08590 [Candidatus Margulisbacteria bacterium]|nr:hypothetical protein [Candidatus Margulisiibacteriota bacterium]